MNNLRSKTTDRLCIASGYIYNFQTSLVREEDRRR